MAAQTVRRKREQILRPRKIAPTRRRDIKIRLVFPRCANVQNHMSSVPKKYISAAPSRRRDAKRAKAHRSHTKAHKRLADIKSRRLTSPHPRLARHAKIRLAAATCKREKSVPRRLALRNRRPAGGITLSLFPFMFCLPPLCSPLRSVRTLFVPLYVPFAPLCVIFALSSRPFTLSLHSFRTLCALLVPPHSVLRIPAEKRRIRRR